MRGLHYRSAYAIGLLGSAALFVRPAAASGEVEVQSSMQCDRAIEPGRVRCTVEARVAAGRTIAWADVEILMLPDFASALKGRIGPQDAIARDATTMKWALGLVARRAGQGEARARLRAVVCDAPRPSAPPAAAEAPARCTPVIVEVKAQVTVG